MRGARGGGASHGECALPCASIPRVSSATPRLQGIAGSILLRVAGQTNVPTLPGPRPPARSRASQHGRLSPLARAVRASSYALRCKIWVTSASAPRSRDTRSRVAAFKVSARLRNSDGHSASLGVTGAFTPDRGRTPTSGNPCSKSRVKFSSGALCTRPRPAAARARRVAGHPSGLHHFSQEKQILVRPKDGTHMPW